MKRERGTGGLFKMPGSKNWYCQFYNSNGKPRRITTGTDNKEIAKGILRKLMAENDRGGAFIGDVRKLYYGDLRAALLQNYLEKGNKSLQITVEGQEHIFGLTPLDEFFEYRSSEEPGVPVTSITTDAARAFARKRMAEAVSNSTINTSLALLRRMLHLAEEDGKLDKVPTIHLLKPNAPRKGFLTREKFDDLLAVIPANLKPLILLLYYCGVRVGEACSVQWSQVDLDAGLIRLEDEQTKNSEGRTVPLPNVLIDVLRKQQPKTGQVFDDTGLRSEWQKACAKVGLGGGRKGGLIIHDLRRSAIRNLMKMGVQQQVAMKISGHKTVSVFQRYNIVDTDDVVEAMRRLEGNLVESKVSTSLVKVAGGRKRVRMLTSSN